MSNVKTRKSTQTKLVDLVGKGKQFIPSEVPTWRSIFQYAVLIQKTELVENNVKNSKYPICNLSHDIAIKVLEQWTLSNSKFQPPVTINQKTLSRRIEKRLTAINKVAKGKASKAETSKALSELDTLCDICVCQHDIYLCNNTDVKCSGCEFKAHIQCDCVKEVKVPRNELQWLYYQRHKKTEISQIQITRQDSTENKKEEVKFKNVVNRKKRSQSLITKEEEEKESRFKLVKQDDESEDETIEDENMDDQLPSTSQR